MSSKLRIIVSGLAALQQVGGMAWHYLQYVVGLARLEHDVYYHADSWCWPYHPVENKRTQVLKWQSYDAFEFEGEEYGLKEPEMTRFLDLPQRTGERLELSIAGHPPADALRASGWILKNGLEVSGSVEDYQSYISSSKAEWSVAKQAYVKTNSGWFSERSACYLASSRPVILQETGYSNWMRTGLGVIPFTNQEEAVAALEHVSTRYAEHCDATRELAHEYFSADKVLRTLIEQAVETDSILLQGEGGVSDLTESSVKRPRIQ